jgi:hypothetical protein
MPDGGRSPDNRLSRETAPSGEATGWARGKGRDPRPIGREAPRKNKAPAPGWSGAGACAMGRWLWVLRSITSRTILFWARCSLFGQNIPDSDGAGRTKSGQEHDCRRVLQAGYIRPSGIYRFPNFLRSRCFGGQAGARHTSAGRGGSMRSAISGCLKRTSLHCTHKTPNIRKQPAVYRDVGPSYRSANPEGTKRRTEIDEHSRQPGAPNQPLRTPNTSRRSRPFRRRLSSLARMPICWRLRP